MLHWGRGAIPCLTWHPSHQSDLGHPRRADKQNIQLLDQDLQFECLFCLLQRAFERTNSRYSEKQNKKPTQILKHLTFKCKSAALTFNIWPWHLTTLVTYFPTSRWPHHDLSETHSEHAHYCWLPSLSFTFTEQPSTCWITSCHLSPVVNDEWAMEWTKLIVN